MRQVLLGILLILFSQQALSSGLQLTAGRSSSKWEGYKDSNTYRFAYVTDLDVNNTWLSDWGISVNLELAYLYWKDFLLENKHGIAVTPMFRYRWNWVGVDLFVEGGIGATYMNGDVWTDRFLGSRWMFEDKLALGVMVKSNHEIALSAVHYSNADLSGLNDGVNNYGLSYSYFW